MTDDGAHTGSAEPQPDLAAEYVLGVLDAPARRDGERRIAEDSRFADEVVACQEWLLMLVSVVPIA